MHERMYPPGECYPYQLTIGKLLDTPLSYCPQREIVYRDRFRGTYRSLYERIQRLADALTALGTAPGDVVAVFDYDSHRYLECYFAIPMMGAVLQTVNWRLSTDQILYTLNHAAAKCAIVHSDFLPLFAAIRERVKTVRTVVTISEGGSAANAAGRYEDLLAAARPVYAFPDLDENTTATTFYTTGTTGNPKGVHFTHRQLMLHTFAVATASACYHTIARFRSDDVYMPLTPMFHVHAWGYPYVAALLGAKQVYPGRYEPERLLALIASEKVTVSHCVPTILQMLLQCPAAAGTDLSNWKVIVGGARLPRGLAAAARKAGIEIHAGYGMSETCPVMTAATPKEHMLAWEKDRLLDVIIKTGRPIPLAQLEVVDPEGNLLPHDGQSIGEVVMRAPWLTQSYLGEPERTRELWRNGWLHSGDVGHIDPEGYLQITDRIKDVIKSGGEWISSLDLENLMSLHEAVLESAAIGVSDEKWGERPLMIVSLKSAYRGQVTAADLKRHMSRFAEAGKLPGYAVPDLYEIVAEIPKTSVGKLDKKALRKSYTRDERHPPGRR